MPGLLGIARHGRGALSRRTYLHKDLQQGRERAFCWILSMLGPSEHRLREPRALQRSGPICRASQSVSILEQDVACSVRHEMGLIFLSVKAEHSEFGALSELFSFTWPRPGAVHGGRTVQCRRGNSHRRAGNA